MDHNNHYSPAHAAADPYRSSQYLPRGMPARSYATPANVHRIRQPMPSPHHAPPRHNTRNPTPPNPAASPSPPSSSTSGSNSQTSSSNSSHFSDLMTSTHLPPPGPSHFHVRRALWLATPPEPPAPPSPSPARIKLEMLLCQEGAAESEEVWSAGLRNVWTGLIGGGQLKKRLPLSIVLKILQAGWMRDGTWPPGASAPPDDMQMPMDMLPPDMRLPPAAMHPPHHIMTTPHPMSPPSSYPTGLRPPPRDVEEDDIEEDDDEYGYRGYRDEEDGRHQGG